MANPEIDYLSMSDEEISNMEAPALTIPDEVVTSEEVTDETVDASSTQVTEDENADEVADDSDPQETSVEGQDADEEEGLLNKDKASATDAKTESTDKVVEPESKDSTEVVDYKAAYEQLFTPFKANGKEIAVKSVDDAVALMQMGANYNKKMAALKPNLKLMKLLENNGLLNESKIGYLIDLDKKNPGAVNKLVKESGLDPLDLNTEIAGDYKPTPYTVDDREMELDTVLDELQSSPTYNQTLDIVSNKWDGPSKQVIANSPQLLKVINSHVESGIYDLISKEIESERVFGRLDGLSDIEAYRQVGDAIQARGGFNHMAAAVKQPAVATTPKPVIVQPKPKMVDEDKLREKKRAASSTQAVANTSVASEYNPLSMSDEEFSKIAAARYS